MALILLIDDEQPIRELLRDILEDAGHRVVEAPDGQAGLEMHRFQLPDLTITDILMPNAGGLHVISEIRRADPKARIIALSGGGRDGKLNFLATAKSFPGVVALKKPCPRSEFMEAVEHLLSVPEEGRAIRAGLAFR